MDESDGSPRRRRGIAIKSTQLFLVAAICLIAVIITVLCIGITVSYEVQTDVWIVDSVSYWKEELAAEQESWYDDGIAELKEAIKIKWELEKARNVIVFIAHGISDEALAAVRFSGGGRGARKMTWEGFSHVGRILTNCSSTNQCDAFTFGTALFGGVRTSPELGGLDSAVRPQDCKQSMNGAHHVKSVLEMAQMSGFRTGFVSTRRVGGPLMASLYAHSSNTKWECDADVPSEKQMQGCKDIAAQLMEEEVDRRINVIMGGGRQTLVSDVPESASDRVDIDVCRSRNGRSFIRDWGSRKKERNAVLENASELNRLNGSDVDFVLGVFANSDIKPSWQREDEAEDNDSPELKDMVKTALQVLRRKKDRFLLVVESGNGRGNGLSEKIQELRRLNTTMHEALKDASPDTLSLVLFTGDGPNLNGTRKSEHIFGNLRLFAAGPSAYLFHGSHEETYFAHAMAYALKIGTFHNPSKRERE